MVWEVFLIKNILQSFLDFYLSNSISFQNYINYRFDQKDVFLKIDGNYYGLNPMIVTVNDFDQYYDFSDVRPTDICLDIGACIGSVAIPLSQKCKKVIAVEPIWYEELLRNIGRNQIHNIQLIVAGLDNQITTRKITFNGKSKMTKCFPLRSFIEMVGGRIDVLKLDCEGGEWEVKPQELQGIRLIIAEIHSFEGMPNGEVFETMLKENGFHIFKKEIVNSEMMTIHAKRIL